MGLLDILWGYWTSLVFPGTIPGVHLDMVCAVISYGACVIYSVQCMFILGHLGKCRISFVDSGYSIGLLDVPASHRLRMISHVSGYTPGIVPGKTYT